MAHVQFVRSRSLAPTPGLLQTLVWGCLAAAAPTLIRAGLDGVVADTVFPAYYPFILAAAIVLGWRCALLATAFSALAANFMFMAPRYEVIASAQEVGDLLVFLVSSAAVIFGAETLRTAVRRAHAPGAWSHPRVAVSRPLPRGHGLLLGAAVSLGLWVGVIWTVISMMRS